MTVARTQSLFFESSKNMAISALQVLGGSLFLAFCSQISVPLYSTPIVISMQTFGMMFIGATLGSRKAVLSVLAYLLEGSIGFPVFAAGSFGWMKFFGPSGGYFLGFLFQAWFVGKCLEISQSKGSFYGLKIFSFLLISCMVQLACGVMWLSTFVGFSSAIMMGAYPFVIGEMIKSSAIAAYLSLSAKK